LKNLYFVYLVVLRAITKAEPYWIKSTFYTGDLIQERELKENIMEIVQAAK
jgi:ERO1-like protein alpha/ERO1-like protein beta